MRNLLKETIKEIEEYGHTIHEVKFITDDDVYCDWEDFARDAKNYNYDEEKICYIAKIDEIYRLDNCYKLSFDDGIYTFDEILNECIRIVEDDDLNCEEELIYGMVKALKHARDGENIYFCVD